MVRKEVPLDIDFYDGKIIVKEIRGLKVQNKGTPTSITVLDRYFEKPILFTTIEKTKIAINKNEYINIYNFDIEIDPY